MADINSTKVKSPDQIDYANYDSGAKSEKKLVVLPPKGKHLFEVLKVVTGPAVRTQEGYLKAELTLKTVAPGQPWDGHEIRFVRISTKRYSNREANGFTDYLRAFGIDQNPQTDAEYIALVNRTQGGRFEAGVNWEAQDPDTREQVARDMDDFPMEGDKRLQYLVRKNDPQNTRIWGRARITYYADKVAK